MPIAETGRNLSGGERQRIALARALLLPFRVLVLDESLSEVDAPTAAAILSAGWVSFLGPLIVWFIYRKRSAAVRRAAAGAFNFNVAFSILYIVGWVLVLTLVGIPVALVLWAVIFLVAAWCHVKGALRSARGESYDYPFQIRILN